MLIRTVIVAVLCMITALLPLLPQASVPVQAADSSSPSMSASAARVTLGRAVTVAGRGAVPLLPVELQMLTADNGWQPLARSRTRLDTSYSFRTRLWYGIHRLRVVLAGTLLTRPWVSPVRTVRVRTPYRPRGPAGDWTWMSHAGARWDPCRTITYRVNDRGAHDGTVADVAAGFRNIARVTGLRFEYLGKTRRVLHRGREGTNPEDTDILVDWQSPRQDPGLRGGVAGIGGHWVLHGRRYDGYVLLDSTARHSRRMWRQVVTHELGHVLGLGHARSRSQVMHGTSSRSNVRWGAGDLAGVRRISASQGCL